MDIINHLHEIQRTKLQRNKVIVILLALAAVAMSAILIGTVVQKIRWQRNTISQFDAYGASSKRDAALVRDFSACLKEHIVIVQPFFTTGCGKNLQKKYGPDASKRLNDAIYQMLTNPQ